jgi:hypothetical protein
VELEQLVVGQVRWGGAGIQGGERLSALAIAAASNQADACSWFGGRDKVQSRYLPQLLNF